MTRRCLTAALAFAGAAVVLCTAIPIGAEEPTEAVAASLQSDSGVVVQSVCTNCNNADLSLGGLGNEHVPIVCDGIPVAPGLAQIYLLTVQPGTMMDKVQVERGAGSAELDAAAVGGGISIRRRDPKPGVDLNFSSDVGSYGGDAIRFDVTGGWDKVRATAAVTRATSEVIDSDEDGNPDLSSANRMTYEAHLDVLPTRNHRIRLGGARYGEDQKDGRAAYPGSDPTTGVWNLEDVDLHRTQFDLTYDGRMPETSQVAAYASWSSRAEEIRETLFGPDSVRIPTYFIDDERMLAGAKWSRAVGSRVRLGFGVDWKQQDSAVVDVRYNVFPRGLGFFNNPLVLSTPIEETLSEAGAFFDGDFQLGAKWNLTAGLRWVDYTYEDDLETGLYPEFYRQSWLAYDLPQGSRLLPRFAVAYKPIGSVTLRLSAGSGFRQPASSYEEVCCGRRYRGNRGLEMERSRSMGLEATWQPDPRLKLAGSVFLTDFENYVAKIVGYAALYQPAYQNANVPDARFRSWSIEGRGALTDWLSVRGSFTWLEADNRSEGDVIPVLADFAGPLPLSFTTARVPYLPTRTGALAFDIKPHVNTTLGVSLQYTGSLLIQTYDPSNPGPFNISTQPFFVGTPSVALANFRFDQRLPAGVGLYAGVDNIMDEVQSTLSDPRFDYNWGPLRGRYYYLGLSYRFVK